MLIVEAINLVSQCQGVFDVQRIFAQHSTFADILLARMDLSSAEDVRRVRLCAALSCSRESFTAHDLVLVDDRGDGIEEWTRYGK